MPEHGDLERVLFVVLGLAAVNGLHGQGVPEHKQDLFGQTEIGEPVPVVSGLDSNDEISTAKGLEGVEQFLRLCFEITMQHDLAILPDDAHIHPLGVQIDTAIEFVLSGVEVHVHTP